MDFCSGSPMRSFINASKPVLYIAEISCKRCFGFSYDFSLVFNKATEFLKSLCVVHMVNQSIIYSSVDNIGHISRARSYYVSLTPCAHGCRDILHRRTLSSCSSSLCLVLGDICVWFGNKTKIRKIIIPKKQPFWNSTKISEASWRGGGREAATLVRGSTA